MARTLKSEREKIARNVRLKIIAKDAENRRKR